VVPFFTDSVTGDELLSRRPDIEDVAALDVDAHVLSSGNERLLVRVEVPAGRTTAS
jgi:hypothetical protein